MKRVASRIHKSFCGFSTAALLIGLFSWTAPISANAATIGTTPCVQTIDTTAGVTVFREGSSCYVAFKTVQSYIWTPPSGINSIDLLVVAGGGGGGSRHAGGGGAGGVINNLNVALTSNNLSITVGGGGGGGAAATSGGNNGSNGFDSVVSGTGLITRTAVGGGGGGYGGGTNSGGSGAGGGSSGAGGAATSGQGNAGSAGLTNSSSYWVGGGGGGAGSGGGASASNKGGNGGAGIEISWITANAASNTGVGVLSSGKYYLAGGGGGGTDSNSIPGGSAGVGGGGLAATGTGDAVSGAANSGGGGGGSGISGVGTGSKKGGDGGSGVVMIRYSIPLFTNSATSSIAENSTTITNAASITVSDSSTIAIQGGVDASFFTIVASDSVTGRVRFIVSPDYEAFADSGANNDYDIIIRATNTSGNFQDFAIKITLTDILEAATIGAPSISGTAYKGRPITVTVIVGTPGKVRFLVAGKKIPNCLYQSTSGLYPNYTATCSWKPSISGLQALSAIVTPTNGSISPVTSVATRVFISKRTTTR